MIHSLMVYCETNSLEKSHQNANLFADDSQSVIYVVQVELEI